jgi:hypothetical protein
MQTGGYFVSKEAEDAAKWRMLQEYNEARSNLGNFDNEFKKIGRSLQSLASAYLMVYGVKFTVSDEGIRAVNTSTGAEIANVPKAYLSFETSVKLITDYEETYKRIRELEASLRVGESFPKLI